MAAQRDFADLALGHGRAGLQLQDHQFHALQGRAAGDQPLCHGRVGVGDGRVSISFGQAIDVADIFCAQVDDHPHLFRRADGGTRAQARQIVPGPVRVLGQGQGNVGCAIEHGAAFPLDQAQGLACLEMMLQDHCAAMAQHGEQGINTAEGPEQRDREPQPVIRAQMHAFANLPHIVDQAPMLQRHPLGPSRGAGGIEYTGDIIRFCRAPDAAWRGFANGGQIGEGRGAAGHSVAQDHQAGEGRQAPRNDRTHFLQLRQDVAVSEASRQDQRRNLGMVQLICLFGRGQPGVQGHRRGAQAQNRKITGQPFGPVTHQDRHPVAGAHAQGPEAIGDGLGFRQ